MSTISSGTTLTTALVQTGDTTGELVIKTNNGNTTAATFSTGGNLTFGATGARIQGDFSNATVANRVAFQTSTANSTTSVFILPSGTGTTGQLAAFNNSDPTNASNINLTVNTTESSVRAGSVGSGTALPMTLYTNGSERMRIDTSGNVGIGVTPSAWYTTNSSVAQVRQASFYAVDNSALEIGNNAYLTSGGSTWNYINTGYATRYNQSSGRHIWFNAASGTAGNAITFTQAMTLDASGRLGIGTSSPVTKFVVSNSGANGFEVYADEASGTETRINSYNRSSAAYTTIGTDALVHKWLTSGTERMRLSSAGGLSVGTTADPGAGAIYATGNITAYYSDDRLKTKLGGIENALDKVKSLSGFYYEANQTAQDLGYEAVREVGVSAQQVQAVLPEVVKPAPIDQQYLTVDYERLVPLLIEAIKELEEKVAKLEAK